MLKVVLFTDLPALQINWKHKYLLLFNDLKILSVSQD